MRFLGGMRNLKYVFKSKGETANNINFFNVPSAMTPPTEMSTISYPVADTKKLVIQLSPNMTRKLPEGLTAKGSWILMSTVGMEVDMTW